MDDIKVFILGRRSTKETNILLKNKHVSTAVYLIMEARGKSKQKIYTENDLLNLAQHLNTMKYTFLIKLKL